MDMLAALFLALGTLMLVAAALGVVKLPDALSRQHAATKAGTLALALLCVGAILAASPAGAWWRLAAIMLLLLVTMPIASHLLARAAARERYRAGELEAAERFEGHSRKASAKARPNNKRRRR